MYLQQTIFYFFLIIFLFIYLFIYYFFFSEKKNRLDILTFYANRLVGK